jgi:alpha-tubulin suppressor-like RCC1 family protein
VNRSQSRVAAILLPLIIAACDGDALTGPGFTCDVTNPVREIILTPSPAVVLVRSPARASDTVQLTAVATNRDGNPRPEIPITFSSSDTSIATVDTLGVVQARKPGTVRITASACDESASTQVSVLPAALTAQITPTADTVLAGDSVTLIARAVGQDGKVLSDTKFSFAASPAGAVTLKTLNDSTVQVVGIAPGVTTITATGDGASVTASITVLPRSFLSVGPLGALGGSFDAGGDLTCGLISLGQGFCWGLNNLGQLGAASDSVCFPELGLPGPPRACNIKPLRFGPSLALTAIAVGDSSACAIATSGRAYCWGDNTFGQIGNGSTAAQKSPTLVTAGLNFTSITVGGGHACALAAGGAAYCWGQDSSGQLGDARVGHSTTPIPVSDGGGGAAIFQSISAGYRHTCALAPGGSAFCWGNNDSAQLGNGTRGSANTPVLVGGGLAFTQISAGGDHTCGVAVGGAAYCWGSNAHGQLGTGTVGGVSLVPLQVAIGLTFSRISASRGTDKLTGRGFALDTTINSSGDTIISAQQPKRDGFGHTCGLTTAGEVYCWGDDSDLQLGRGPATGGPSSASGVPLPVFQGERPSGVTFTTISTGTRHSCAVGSDGNAYCWGSNVFGSLGNTLQAAFRGQPQKVATPQ